MKVLRKFESHFVLAPDNTLLPKHSDISDSCVIIGGPDEVSMFRQSATEGGPPKLMRLVLHWVFRRKIHENWLNIPSGLPSLVNI